MCIFITDSPQREFPEEAKAVGEYEKGQENEDKKTEEEEEEEMDGTAENEKGQEKETKRTNGRNSRRRED